MVRSGQPPRPGKKLSPLELRGHYSQPERSNATPLYVVESPLFECSCSRFRAHLILAHGLTSMARAKWAILPVFTAGRQRCQRLAFRPRSLEMDGECRRVVRVFFQETVARILLKAVGIATVIGQEALIGSGLAGVRR